MELKFDAKYSQYLLTNIHIETAYKWGSGWSKQQSDAFDKETHEAFERAGYVVENSNFSGSSNTLKKNGFGEQLNLYMHPMEFSGYATMEQIDEIVSILQNCETVYDVYSISVKEVYDVTTSQYKTILAKNSKEIIAWLNNYKSKHGYMQDAGFEFARKYRPLMKCFSNYGGLCSSDADIEFINNLIIIAEENGLL